jgi:Fic family protein
MFIEERKIGKKIKYYLVHSYRIGNKVKRVSRYLGSDLKKENLERLTKRAEELILEEIKEKNPFEFELEKEELEKYKKYEAKIEIIHLKPDEWKRFTELFTYNTNAIEGSTVELSEVKAIIEHKECPSDSDEIEALNVAKAVDFIRTTKETFSSDLIKKIHQICFEGTKHFAGKTRDVEVVIRDSQGNIIHRGAPAKDVDKLLKKLVNWYEKHKNKYSPLLLAVLVHNEFENIHPFQDGNGRVGRLLLNYVLLKSGYPPINILLKDRMKYYQVLQDYQKKGIITSTLKFLTAEYKKQYKR